MPAVPTIQFSIPIKQARAEKLDWILVKAGPDKAVSFYYDGSNWTPDGNYVVQSVSYSNKIVITINYIKGNEIPSQATYIPANP